MKHPAYRCSDILFVNPEYRDKAYEYVRWGVQNIWLPSLTRRFDFLRTLPEFKGVDLDPSIKIQHVGSAPFGCASLHSDWDFNLSLKDWNSQAEARKWFFSQERAEFGRYMDEWTKVWGFDLQVGCVDPHTDEYNIFVDLDTMLLHRRGSKLPHKIVNNTYFTTDDRIPPALPPINLLTWNPEGKVAAPSTVTPENVADYNPDLHVPPIAWQHLQWDGYAMRWISVGGNRGVFGLMAGGIKKLGEPYRAKWSVDEHAELAQEYEKIYGERYTGYDVINNECVEKPQDRPLYATT